MDKPTKTSTLTATSTGTSTNTVILIAVITGVVMLLIGLGIGFAGGRLDGRDTRTLGSRGFDQTDRSIRSGSGRAMKMGQSNADRLEGVVTAIDGASFTLAGGGTTHTVTTNDSTSWSTSDKQVAVNDSVVVTYTGSGSSVTATAVRVLTQQ